MGRRIGKKVPATYDDLLAAPDHLVAELIDGTLYTSPRPALPHARAASALHGDLDGPFDRGRGGPGGWIILFEPEIHIVGQVMVPDLGGWRRVRVPEIPKAPAFDIAPDWLCEVVSPSTAALDRKVKLPKYAQAGVQHVWLVDPDAQTLEVLSVTGGGRWETIAVHSEDDKVRAVPFEAHDIELAALWRL